MRTALRMFALSMAILTLTASAARATHTVYAPNYPTLSQLESGWNAAFVSWLAVQYGGTPVITSTTTYAGPDGQIFVVSSFTAGTINGRILGRAFDPQEATPVGDGSYSYQVKSTGAFTCTSDPESTCAYEPHERHYQDGSYERWCACRHQTGAKGASVTLMPADSFTGSYRIRPGDYGSLPALN